MGHVFRPQQVHGVAFTRRRRRWMTAFLVVCLTLAGFLVSPASAHGGYDGNPDGEGLFVIGFPGSHKIWGTATDTNSDGHCVYINMVFGGTAHTDAYSCGAADTATYSDPGFTTAWKCVTGHWDCNHIWSGTP